VNYKAFTENLKSDERLENSIRDFGFIEGEDYGSFTKNLPKPLYAQTLALGFSN
jgi:hypothetical protein